MGCGARRKQRWCTSTHQPLTPLIEGPDLEMQQERSKKESSSWEAIREWFRVQRGASMATPPDYHQYYNHDDSSNTAGRQDLRLLLGVLACPLAPIPLPLKLNTNHQHNPTGSVVRDHHHLPPPINKHIPIETCTAHYIIQQYLAATGWSSKQQKTAKNMYAAGSVRMVCCQTEVSSAVGKGGNDYKALGLGTSRSGSNFSNGEKGCFVLWQMSPGMWSLELVVAGNKVLAGSDSKIVWRHTPWLGTHAAKGPQRPLRRIIQGLDPKSTASLFAGKAAQCMGEKRIGDEDCFVIKVAADRAAVMERNEGPAAEVVRHVLYGYFSQRSGLLIYPEDSHLTRVLAHHQSASTGASSSTSSCNEEEEEEEEEHPGNEVVSSTAVYWETTIGSSIEDYRDVDGVLIAHEGRTVATVFRFGETCCQQYSRITMEEIWNIQEVVFDVPGLSVDCFIPPADIWDTHTRTHIRR